MIDYRSSSHNESAQPIEPKSLAHHSNRSLYQYYCERYGQKPKPSIMNVLPQVEGVFDLQHFEGLSGNFLGTMGLKPLLNVFFHNLALSHVSFRCCGLSNRAIPLLYAAICTHPRWRSLDLSDNPITELSLRWIGHLRSIGVRMKLEKTPIAGQMQLLDDSDLRQDQTQPSQANQSKRTIPAADEQPLHELTEETLQRHNMAQSLSHLRKQPNAAERNVLPETKTHHLPSLQQTPALPPVEKAPVNKPSTPEADFHLPPIRNGVTASQASIAVSTTASTSGAAAAVPQGKKYNINAPFVRRKPMLDEDEEISLPPHRHGAFRVVSAEEADQLGYSVAWLYRYYCQQLHIETVKSVSIELPQTPSDFSITEFTLPPQVNLGDYGAIALIEALAVCTNLHTIGFRGGGFGDFGIHAIAYIVQSLPAIQWVDIADNQWTEYCRPVFLRLMSKIDGLVIVDQ